MNWLGVSIQVVDLIDQADIRRGSDDSAVVDQAGNRSDDVGSSTDAEHPYLRMDMLIPSEVLDDELVNFPAFLSCLCGKSAVPKVVQETAVQADSVEISGTDIGW